MTLILASGIDPLLGSLLCLPILVWLLGMFALFISISDQEAGAYLAIPVLCLLGVFVILLLHVTISSTFGGPANTPQSDWNLPSLVGAVLAALFGIGFIGLPAGAAYLFGRQTIRRKSRMSRRTSRLRRGYCPYCDYDLTANQSGTCPECGAATNISEPTKPGA